MKKLPIGIQTFKDIIEDNYLYVDKTSFALKLIDRGKYYFLSRPRRFGKSLFLDTLAEIFLGHKELFKGLFIYDKYDFKPYPIIRISFGSGDYSEEEIIYNELEYILTENIENLEVECKNIRDYKGCFKELIRKSYKKYNSKVVILIDEYDKPILDNITNMEMAIKARSILRNFYGIIKDSDRYVKFVFITGVSKFSKLNLFSGLNNLEDITVNPEYAEICGYTHRDLETVFYKRLKGVDLDIVKKWYNGYNYFGEPLYNPFDILLFISNKYQFRNYWWSTGNPKFLIDKLKKDNYYIPDLENAVINEESLDAFDVDFIDIRALLWQTGYLTFKERYSDEVTGVKYKLKIPNREVQLSLNQLFIDYLTNQRYDKLRYQDNLLNALREDNIEKFVENLKIIFSSIPYNNYANKIISKYEGYYSSVIFVYLMALGYDVIAEDVTNKGRIDLTLITKDKILIIEFKVDSKEQPIKQIKQLKYYEKYLNKAKKIYLVGINFNSKERNIIDYQIEPFTEI